MYGVKIMNKEDLDKLEKEYYNYILNIKLKNLADKDFVFAGHYSEYSDYSDYSND